MSNEERLEWDNLLLTKLTPPWRRGELVVRARLVARLEQAKRYTLTLLSTPAGFGKTFLLAEWFSSTTLPCTWLSLDEGDDEFTRFWRYIIATLQTLYPQVGGDALGFLLAPQSLPAASILISLLNDLATIPSDMILVLDDYHVLTSDEVHNSLAFFLERVPPQIHLVIAGRTDPPLPLARLRAHGGLLELRTLDLRFTPDEAVAFLRNVMALSLQHEDALALAERTEGWIAGLQLAALSLQRQPQSDLAPLARLFSGQDRYILEYLLAEVLQWQPPEIQEFLLRTSILTQLCAPLCVAVTGQQNSHAMLEKLERANLFLLPLDNERRWYRYHALFVDLLRYQLTRGSAPMLPELHRRAASWYEQHSFLPEAMTHLLALPDDAVNTAHAIDLIVEHSQSLVLRGDASLLLSWTKRLPEHLRRTPDIALASALALLVSSRFHEVEELLQIAEANMPEVLEDVDQWIGRLAALRSTVVVNVGGEVEEAISLSRQALELLPAHDSIGRGIAALNLGDALMRQEALIAAQDAFIQAVRYNVQAENYFVASTTLASLGSLLGLQGRLRDAEQHYRLALRYARQEGRTLPTAGKAHAFLADIFLERNEVEAAVEEAREGLRLCEQWGHTRHICDSYLALAKALHVHGERAQAFQMLDEALQVVTKARDEIALYSSADLDLLVTRLDIGRQRLHAWQGEYDMVEDWVRERRFAEESLLELVRQELFIRVLIARGQYREAQRLLHPLLESSRARRLGHYSIALSSLDVLAYVAQEQEQEALKQLINTLQQAQSEGYVRTFVEQGALLIPLLRTLSKHDDVGAYARRLLLAFPSGPEVSVSSELVEPLRERELVILRLLAAGLSNRDIAEQLVLTLGTVKWYVNAIYSKLSVRSRTQAVARARELDLLS
ncbi:LuxR C-terminal-related transcriptional regulator [Ktedonospora formicarum]|nr:LuxR C-terminal-related transcriptional regulator [Ktedonospora formicarum]